MKFKKFEFSVTAREVIDRSGWTVDKASSRRDKTVLRYCPVCHGGEHKDERTFFVNVDSSSPYYGAYKCMRLSCQSAGNLWKLIEMAGMEPRDYWVRETKTEPYQYQLKKLRTWD